jgi:hypothetical protein
MYATLEEKKENSKEYNKAYYDKNRKEILRQKKEQREKAIDNTAKEELKAWVEAFWKKKDPWNPFSED